MVGSTSPQFETNILHQAMLLPAAARLSLASQLIQSLEREQALSENGATSGIEARSDQGSLANIIGLWANVHPKPTDEEIEQILEDERMRKFGV